MTEVNLLPQGSYEDGLDNEMDMTGQSGTGSKEGQDDGINAEEFEHIAEIYDQIRMLHQKILF